MRQPEDNKEKTLRNLEEGQEEKREESEEGELVGETLEPDELRRQEEMEAAENGGRGNEPVSLQSIGLREQQEERKHDGDLR